MSTYFAVLENLGDARGLAHELLRLGISPDDINVISRETSDQPISEGTTGDATTFVGRDDDPTSDSTLPTGSDLTDKTTVAASPLMGIDTSDRTTDVESVDQSDDGQSLMEDSIQAENYISQGEHEKDDLVLTLNTGFPTTVPVIDDIRDSETPVQDQFDQALETIGVSNLGTVIGGGSLATAAIGFDDPSKAIVDYLVDEGMPEDRVKLYASAFRAQMAILAVQVNPGDINEGTLEEYVSLHKVHESDLIDAPRFYEGGGKASVL